MWRPYLLGMILSASFPFCLEANPCNTAPVNGESHIHRFTQVHIQGSMPGRVRDGILAGTEMWNACNSEWDDWPFFIDDSSGSEDDLYFSYDPGTSSEGCASNILSTGEVTLYASFDPPGSTPPIDCDHSTLALSQTVAHEVGHYLGLGHTECDRAIMGPVRAAANGQVMTDYDITHKEKAKADALNTNPREEWIEECQENPNCGEPNPSNTSPLLLDLDGDGFHLSGLADPVRFDINGNFTKDTIGWTARGSGDGFLYRNRYRTAGVDNGTELFGTATRSLLTGERSANGYEALAEFDLDEFGGNQNGWIDPGDVFFRNLGVWVDRNHDAVSQASELSSLAEAGVQRIRLQYWTVPVQDRHGNELRFWSYGWNDTPRGSRRMWTTDVFFVLDENP